MKKNIQDSNQIKFVKAKLNLFDRISIPMLLPEQESYTVAIICRDLRKKVALTQSEIKKFNIRATGANQIIWDDPKNTLLSIELTELELDLIHKGFERLDNEKRMPTTDAFLDFRDKMMKLKIT